MAVVAVESRNGAQSPDFDLLTGVNYEIVLKESIDRFLDECGKGISDLSCFGSIFFRLLQSTVDPPLEVIWFYSAVSFRSSSLTGNDPLSRVSMAKDLFQFLAACSASSDGLKSVALLAPVLFELYQSVVELCEQKLSSKSQRKIMREIECLMEGIVSYISICCSKDLEEGDASVGLLSCFSDLIHVWMVDRFEGNREMEDLKLFFPLISDEIRQGLGGSGCTLNDLAGVVIAEAFLLRLCLKFRSGLLRAELQKELRTLTVGSIAGFRNYYFFKTLVRMLLESTLPVASLLDPDDEILLRKVLYDAVVLVDYPFLSLERGIRLPDSRMRSLAVKMLIIAHEALLFARAHGDQTKAISYVNAVSGSRLASHLIKWASYQIGMEEKACKPNLSTPIALIRWLLKLEEKGVIVFDHEISKHRAKLMLELSKEDYDYLVFKSESKNIDNKGEDEGKGEMDQEMVESVDSSVLGAAPTMKSTADDGRRKRKEGLVAEGESRVKFVKLHIHNNSVKDDGSYSGSEVENPFSDENMEEMEQ